MSIPEATQNALAAQKRQSVKETRKKLEYALLRLTNGNPQVVKKGVKISAASVAKEAGVDRVTLYRFHEPVLVEIRKINDTAPKAQLKESRSELAQTSTKLKEYRQLVEEAQEEVAALARINYRLDGRISELEGLIRVRDEVIAGLQKQLNERASKPKIMPLKTVGLSDKS
jgi:uncharacterized coiled-coil protein SlyX